MANPPTAAAIVARRDRSMGSRRGSFRQGDHEGEAQAFAAAGVGAVQAAQAFRRLPLVAGRTTGRAVASLRAEVALVAHLLFDLAAQERPASEDAQQRPQRAEIAAPEPRPDFVQEQQGTKIASITPPPRNACFSTLKAVVRMA